jgi:hypothetical protein
MSRKFFVLLIVSVLSFSFLGYNPQKSDAAVQDFRPLKQSLDQPPFFTENKGQWDSPVYFVANVPFGQIGLGQGAIYYHQIDKDSGNVVKISFAGANQCIPEGLDPLPGYYNYFSGSDSKKWITDVKNYRQIIYRDIYSGIDLYYAFQDRNPKYEFHVRPNADSSLIQMRVEGGNLQANGTDHSLEISTSLGLIKDQNLKVFTSTSQKIVRACFKTKLNVFCFQVGDYNRSEELIIDPILYSSFLGGASNDYTFGQTIDSRDNIYLTGYTTSIDFPTTPGSYLRSLINPLTSSAFVSKIDTRSNQLVFSTFLDGAGNDYGYGIKLDSLGNVIILGETNSINFPTTPGAFDRTSNGGLDLFVTKLNPSGTSLIFSTLCGGWNHDQVCWNPGSHSMNDSIVIDFDNSIFLAATTLSPDFPVTPGAISTLHHNSGGFDVVIFHLNSLGNTMISSTYLGGSLDDTLPSMAMNSRRELIIVGHTKSINFPLTPDAIDGSYNAPQSMFISIINSSLTTIHYSSFFGTDVVKGPAIEIDQNDKIYVVDSVNTQGSIPIIPGAFQPTPPHSGGGDLDAFIAVFSTDAKILLHSTYYGESSGDPGTDIQVDAQGNIYVVGYSFQNSFLKVTTDAFSKTNRGGNDLYLLRFSPDLSILSFATYLGGANDDYCHSLLIDSWNQLFLSGYTKSSDLPMPAIGFSHSLSLQNDVFIYKLTTNIRSEYDQITIQWNNSLEKNNLIKGYAIYKSIDGDSFPAQPFRVLSNTTFQYSDQYLQCASFFQYQVYGIDVNDVQIPATPVLYYNTPSIPGNGKTSSADRSILISWDPSIPGTIPIGGYQIYRSDKEDFSASTVVGSVSASTTQFLDENTTPHVTYYYKVLAFDTNQVCSYLSDLFNGSALILAPVLILSPDMNKKEFTTGDAILIKMDIINQGDRSGTNTVLTLDFPDIIDFISADKGLQVKVKNQSVSISAGTVPANSKKTVNLICYVKGKVSIDTKTEIGFSTICEEGSTDQSSILFIVKIKKTTNTSVNISVTTSNLQQDPVTGKSFLNLGDELLINYEVSGGAPPYTVLVNWGDGSSSKANIDKYGKLSGQFGHKYSSRGTVRVKIKIEDASGQSKESNFDMEIR